ncbi:MAG: PAS domain-containing sensor histidine kinase, partial [Archangium sp.]
MSWPLGDTSRSLVRAGSDLEFETLISGLSSRFFNLPPGKLDSEIEDVQRRVCELVGIDSSVFWQASTALPDSFSATHYYTRGGVRPPEPMRQEHFPHVSKQILAGRMVRIASLDELPPEAAVDRQHAELLGIKSNLSLPISSGGALPVACLAFIAIEAERDWPDALVNRLQLVAQVFGDALVRKRADEALRESEERLSLALDCAEAGVSVLDFNTGVYWAPARTRAMFGFSPDEVITMERLEARVHPEDLSLLRDAVARGIRSRESGSVEYRILKDDGDVRWISNRGRILFTPTGEPDRLMGVSVDVTDRKRSEKALLASEARLRAGAELANLAFLEVDFGAGMLFADERLNDLLGIPPDQEGLQPIQFWMENLHPDDATHVLDVRQEAIEGTQEQFCIEYRYLHPSRGEMWIQHMGRPVTRAAAGQAVRTISVLRDITQSKRDEQDVHDLSRRILRAHEEERARLARELHDDVSQRLAVLAINLGRAEHAPRGEQAEEMRAVREGLVRLSDDVHSLAYQLHPAILEELGLAEALRTEGERHRRQGLHVWVHLDPLPAALADDLALCLFRVTQEALNNVTRHAKATVATVRLRQTEDGLLLA